MSSSSKWNPFVIWRHPEQRWQTVSSTALTRVAESISQDANRVDLCENATKVKAQISSCLIARKSGNRIAFISTLSVRVAHLKKKWTHQCRPTCKKLHSSSLCGYSMPFGELAGNDNRLGRMARKRVKGSKQSVCLDDDDDNYDGI